MKWVWENKDIDEDRFDRIKEIEPIQIDQEKTFASFQGKNGIFCCSFAQCECQDFRMRLRGKSPCKHILYLGAELGAYDPVALKRYFDGKRAIDRLSLAYGRYYLFNDPVMSNEEYDAMKQEWLDLIPEKESQPKIDSDVDSVDMDRLSMENLLKEHNIRFVDRMGSGGCFWIEKNEQSETLLAHVTMEGLKLESAINSKALGHKPALYYRRR